MIAHTITYYNIISCEFCYRIYYVFKFTEFLESLRTIGMSTIIIIFASTCLSIELLNCTVLFEIRRKQALRLLES